MGSISVGAGLGAFESYLANLKTTFTLPTVDGSPITDYLGNTGAGEALQLSAAQVAFEFPATPSPLYLLVDGVGLGLPSTDLNGPINLADATGTVTSATLYSGGTFSDGVVNGGVEIASVVFSSTAYTFTAGTASLTISGSDLPTTAGVVESITSGGYAGGNLAVSEITATDNGQSISLSLTPTAFTLDVGDYSIALNGNFPTSLTAAEINALATHSTSTFDTLLGVSGIDVTGVTITDTATDTVVESATASPGGVPVSSLTLGGNGGVGEAVAKLLGLVAGGTLVRDGDVATVTSLGTEIDGAYLSAGGFAIVADGGYEIVSSGGVASGTVLLDEGQQQVLSGGSATDTVISSGGEADISAGASTSGATVNSGGVIMLFATATASDVTISSGGAVGFSHGVGTGLTVSVGAGSSAGASQFVTATTVSGGVTIDSGGEIEYGYQVYSGGVISGLGTYFGTIDLGSGAVGDDLTIGSGGQLIVEYAETDSGTTIRFGGVETFDQGATPGAAELQPGAMLDLNTVQLTGAVVDNVNDQLQLLYNGNLEGVIGLLGQTIDMSAETFSDGHGGTEVLISPTPVRDDFKRNGFSDILIQNTAGAVVVGQMGFDPQGFAQENYNFVAGLAPEWSFVGTGDFLDDNNEDFLIENTAGAVVAGEVVNGSAQYSYIASLDSSWTFKGSGEFLGDGRTGFLIENTAGAVVVGEVVNGAAQYTYVTTLDSSWTFEETGDFLGDGKSDFLIENTAGAVVLGEIVNGAAQYTYIGGLGPEWHFVGAGDYYQTSTDSFMIENTAGAIVAGTVVNGAAQYTYVTNLASQWSFHG
jgi:autotransporter passenger strand-loop-strand repeat protein